MTSEAVPLGMPALWAAFAVCIALLMVIDLGVLHRRGRTSNMREAAMFTAFVVALAMAFGAGIYAVMGGTRALEYYTGYVVEEALSVDNLFVFILIFDYFKVPKNLQHRVLFWGVFGALVMRAGFILLGTTLLHYFHWIFYVFGVILVVSGIKMAFKSEEAESPEKSLVVRIYRRFIPTTAHLHGGDFVVRQDGRLLATPLLLVLVVVEISDIVFAVDSIPAIFAVTTDPFLVYTSNVFAIMGLRSMYFLLAGAMGHFHFLSYGLGAVLTFVGAKMLLADFYAISTGISLLVIGGILAAAMGLSVAVKKKTV